MRRQSHQQPQKVKTRFPCLPQKKKQVISPRNPKLPVTIPIFSTLEKQFYSQAHQDLPFSLSCSCAYTKGIRGFSRGIQPTLLSTSTSLCCQEHNNIPQLSVLNDGSTHTNWTANGEMKCV